MAAHRRLVLLGMASVLLLSGCMLSPLFQAPAVVITGIAMLLGLAACGSGGGGGGGGGDETPAPTCKTTLSTPLGDPTVTWPSTITLSQLYNAPSLGVVLTGVANARFGASVSAAGDVDGDGICDIAMGAPKGGERGITYLLFGSKTIGSLVGGTSSSATGPYPISSMAGDGGGVEFARYTDGFGYFGYSVAIGKINDGSRADLLIGAPGEFEYDRNGEAWVIYGDSRTNLEAISTVWIDNESGLPDDGSRGFMMRNEQALGNYSVLGSPYYYSEFADRLGTAVAVVNILGDGISRPLVASPGTDTFTYCYSLGYDGSVAICDIPGGTGYSRPMVTIFKGDPAAEDLAGGVFDVGGESSAYDRASATEYTEFGMSIADAGDVNGDGIRDVIIGMPYYGASSPQSGRAILIFGQPGGSANFNLGANSSALGSGNRGVVLNNPYADRFYAGFHVASAGDLNGDGYDDVLVSAEGDNASTNDSVFVVYGRSVSSWASANGQITLGTEEGLRIEFEYQHTVVGLGGHDLNGDGYSDIIIGLANDTESNYGDNTAAFVLFGGPLMNNTEGVVDADQNADSGSYGFSVVAPFQTYGVNAMSVSFGDVNGDGLPDMVFGIDNNNSETDGEGKVYIIFGKSSGSFPEPEL